MNINLEIYCYDMKHARMCVVIEKNQSDIE